jgi:hypothetical protein
MVRVFGEDPVLRRFLDSPDSLTGTRSELPCGPLFISGTPGSDRHAAASSRRTSGSMGPAPISASTAMPTRLHRSSCADMRSLRKSRGGGSSEILSLPRDSGEGTRPWKFQDFSPKRATAPIFSASGYDFWSVSTLIFSEIFLLTSSSTRASSS